MDSPQIALELLKRLALLLYCNSFNAEDHRECTDSPTGIMSRHINLSSFCHIRSQYRLCRFRMTDVPQKSSEVCFGLDKHLAQISF